MNRAAMEEALICKFRNDQNANYEAYKKKIKKGVTQAVQDEYDLVILGKQYTPKKKVKEW